MRIALVHSRYSSRQPSGENNAVDAQVRALRRAGHEVLVAQASTDQREQRFTYPAEAAWTAMTGWGVTPAASLRKWNPDVVHVHNLFPNFGRRWVRDWAGPIVASLHNFRPLCPSGSLVRELKPCFECPDAQSAANAVRHRCFHGSRTATVPVALGTRFAADPLLQRADLLTTLSSTMSDIYARYGVAPNRLRVLENFAPTPPDSVGSGRSTHRDYWVFAGRIEEGKGLTALLGRWPAHHRLKVIGSALDPECLVEMPNVDYIGTLSHADTLEMIAGAKGLIFPSILPEAMSLVCLEALSVGTPVLTFDDIPAGARVADLGVGLSGPRSDFRELLDRAAVEFDGLREQCRLVHREHFSEEAWLTAATALYSEVRAVAQ